MQQTATDLARQLELSDVFVCLTETSSAVVEDDVLSVYPATQGGLSVTSIALVLPKIDVLLTGEGVEVPAQGRDAAVFIKFCHDVLVFGG